MTAFPPLDLRLQSARLSCVIDLRLALSRWGLMFAWRLSEEMDIWFYRGFWALLDDAERCLKRPESLVEGAARGIGQPLDVTIAAEALRQWEPARLEDNVPSFPFYYVGDLRYESHLPKDVGASLIRRFDLLTDALDRRTRRPRDKGEHSDPGHPEFGSPLPQHHQVDCWRDAAALHAALAHQRPLTLTLYEGKEEQQAPALCQFLARSGLKIQKMRWPGDANPMRDYLTPSLIRTGAAELVWGGMPLAAVHVVAPGAFAIPRQDEDDEERLFLDPEPIHERDAPPPRDPWRGAVCIWYPLT